MQSKNDSLSGISLDSLEMATRQDLLEAWRKLIKRPPPKHLSQPLLCAIIAFELQCRQHPGAGISKTFLNDLRRAATTKAKRPRLRHGGRLVRDWQGRRYVVEVTEDGYHFNETSWTSLTSIATEITGTHQSGPRFFGIAR